MFKIDKKLKFEEAMKRLDAIVDAMESGEIGIEEALDRYEEAMALKAHCQAVLDQAEQRIRRIQVEANGQVTSTRFETPADEGEESGG